MSYIDCVCGHKIFDHSKNSQRATYISGSMENLVIDNLGDQLKSLIDENGTQIDKSDINDLIWSTIFFEYSNDIYACNQCGRLYIQCSTGEERFMMFQPEDPDENDWISSGHRVQRGSCLIKIIE